MLEENAEYIKRSRDVYTAGAAPAPSASVGALTDLENKSREAASSLDGDSWDRTRKLMRQDQHKTKVQQAY